MTEKKRMPPLTMDEVMLLVDTYYCLQGVESKSIKEEVIAELSKAMRSLPFYRELRDNSAFRSVSGMKMCLENVAYEDSSANSKFGHGSVSQRKVLEYYGDKKEELHAEVQAIKKLAHLEFSINDRFKNFIGGSPLPSYHCHLEASDKAIQAVRAEAKAQCQTKCRTCGQDLSIYYGKAANDLIELHINLPLSQNTPDLDISPSDLIILCPTCHKLAHMDPLNFTVDKLQLPIKEDL